MIRVVRVVGFIGNAGAGKTTAANYLVSKGYVKLRFAEALKTMLMLGLGVDKAYIDGSKKDEPCEELCGRTARHAMITLGTEWGREMIHRDIWIKALEKILTRDIALGEDRFVIDDFRFISEVEWLRNLDGAKKIKIEETVVNGKRIGGVHPDIVVVETCLIRVIRDGGIIIDHQSETEQIGVSVDFTIDNTRSLDLLHKTIDVAIEHLFKKE